MRSLHRCSNGITIHQPPEPLAENQNITQESLNSSWSIRNGMTTHSPPKSHPAKQIAGELPRPPLVLSGTAMAKVELALQHSLAPSTTKGYENAVKQFNSFCEHEKVPVNIRFPADKALICAFAASNAGRLSASTIRNQIAGLRSFHIKKGLPWNGSHRLQYILNGVDALAPPNPNQPRPAVTAEMLESLIHRLDLNDPLDAAVAACASVAFWGQCRLGELLQSSVLNTKNKVIPSRRHLKPPKRHRSQNLHLPCTKTSRRGQEVVLVRQDGLSNPISLLSNHLRINPASSSLNLFTYVSPRGLRNLTKKQFLSRCNEIWSKLGSPRHTGHCFRIGGTTELLLAGVPPDVVKKMGRWNSDSFLRYWRSVDDLADLHAKDLQLHRRL